jgi:hypothetical protein
MNRELSEDTILTLKHSELVDPVMSCIARFHGVAGALPETLVVSMKVWNKLGRPRQFMGMCVICDSKLNGESIYCTMEGAHTS